MKTVCQQIAYYLPAASETMKLISLKFPEPQISPHIPNPHYVIENFISWCLLLKQYANISSYVQYLFYGV